jgi:lipopolysaccharide export system ATP-binding protein
MKSGIVCANIKKKIGSKIVLKDVSIKANRGEIVALLGPNGAGKTTSFSMLCGLIKPDDGKIFLDGHDITELPMYKRARLGVGYLPQEASIFRGLSVEENIYAVLEVNGVKEDKIEASLDQLLANLSIEHIRKSPSISISGGERRKLEIARALAASPSFILLDEPFAGIDPLAVAEMKEIIFALKKRGIGVIITDHNVRDTLPVSDYAYILNDGEILIEGKPEDIIKDKTAQEIYLGESFLAYNSSYGKEK